MTKYKKIIHDQIDSVIKEKILELDINAYRLLETNHYFIISALLCYNVIDQPVFRDNKAKNSITTITGNIAPYTSKNYYKTLYKELEKLAKQLKPLMQESDFFFNTVSVNGRLPDKKIAAVTGLGKYCKNSLIYHPEFGTMLILGEIVYSKQNKLSLTDFIRTVNRLFSTIKANDICHDCHKCIQACPTNAITKFHRINRQKCLQHLSSIFCTFGPAITQAWGRRLYGCTICQDVCPLNKKVKTVKHKTEYGVVGKQFSLEKILQTPYTEQKGLFKGNQIGAAWVSQMAIRRNAILALATYKTDEAVSMLQKALLAEPVELKPYIIQALTNIDNDKSRIFLENQEHNAELPDYIREIISKKIKNSNKYYFL